MLQDLLLGPPNFNAYHIALGKAAYIWVQVRKITSWQPKHFRRTVLSPEEWNEPNRENQVALCGMLGVGV